MSVVISMPALMLICYWMSLLGLDSSEAVETLARLILTDRILRTHWIIGLIIAVGMGIIALTATLQHLEGPFMKKFELLIC